MSKDHRRWGWEDKIKKEPGAKRTETQLEEENSGNIMLLSHREVVRTI